MEHRRALRRAISRGVTTQHIEVDVLEEYYRGEVSPELREQIQEHMTSCPECAATFLDFVRFLQNDVELVEVDPEELVDAWKDLQARLFADSLSMK